MSENEMTVSTETGDKGEDRKRTLKAVAIIVASTAFAVGTGIVVNAINNRTKDEEA